VLPPVSGEPTSNEITGARALLGRVLENRIARLWYTLLMFRDHRVLVLSGIGIALGFVGQVGETFVGGLGASVHRFTPPALGWSAVSLAGSAILGIGWLLGARKATRPRLVRTVGLVFLIGSLGLMASMPFVVQHVR
jgi:hypothetical protein